MVEINLGNVVGLVRSTKPPKEKPYVIWGKVLDESNPNIVELQLYKGEGDPEDEANWGPLKQTSEFDGVNFLEIYLNEAEN